MSAIHNLEGATNFGNKVAPIGSISTRRSRKPRERGATLLEFAFALVITLVLMFGMIDFACALYSFHFVSEAAREGTRFASVRGADSCGSSVTPCQASSADIQAYVMQLVPLGINSAQVNVNPTWVGSLPMCGPPPQDYPGCTVQVQVTYSFNYLFPSSFYNLPPVSFQATTIDMSSTSQMTISR
jgi:Flp pilus assembly protein TadG